MSFPADRFSSFADHAAWEGENATILAARALAERACVDHPGSCVPCLRAARFRLGRCDCPDGLDPASRALLHASVAEGGLCAWTRLLLPDTGGALALRLSAAAGATMAEAEPGSADLAVIPSLDTAPAPALAASARALAAGGCLLAGMAFDVENRRGRRGEALGWDILEAAREAGFARAWVLRPWSRELGYLVPVFLLKAVV